VGKEGIGFGSDVTPPPWKAFASEKGRRAFEARLSERGIDGHHGRNSHVDRKERRAGRKLSQTLFHPVISLAWENKGVSSG